MMYCHGLKQELSRISLLLCFILLASCAGLETSPTQEYPELAPGSQPASSTIRFKEWQVTTQSMGDSGMQVAAPAAIIKLSQQVDRQIAAMQWQAASDTLERLLRISPDYAPGWSRMAWVALQTNAPERARQMASRSNSYATGRIDLKILNWKFIRDASAQLDDKGAVQRSERNIHELENL